MSRHLLSVLVKAKWTFDGALRPILDGLLEDTMTQKFYAQDTCFYSSMGNYSFEDRCEMTKAVGYDATYISICDGRNWATAQQLNSVKDALRH